MTSQTELQPDAQGANLPHLKDLIRRADTAVFPLLVAETRRATQFALALSLNNLRKRAEVAGLGPTDRATLRLAVIGGPTLRPLADLVEHFTSMVCDAKVDIHVGEYDSYISEIMDPEGELYAFKPSVILVLPAAGRCEYKGTLADPVADQRSQAEAVARDLLDLCKAAADRSGAEVIVCNFALPPHFDPGPMRSSALGSDYSFRKYVNMQLGLNRPSSVHICDAEFLANRLGTVRAVDDRAWFESKQPYSAEMLVHLAREVAETIAALKRPAKKVLVLDLDNTLWGGVVGDDGVEGIEIGTTSPRGEAFRAFQHHLLALSQRGVLLTVCSKNDHDKAIEPFVRHPEMVLRLDDIVNFKANWEPKSDNIRKIAAELNLGLDSLVFVDDNPAEVEIVRQFVPEVTGICLGDDPSLFASMLKDSRLFEVSSLTKEDLERVSLYKQDAERQQLLGQSTDMDAYLTSLQMVGHIAAFSAVDAPRISQLINKSNQFNLTTVRRTEAEVLEVMRSDRHAAFTMRLTDRFGDHGLILVVVARVDGDDLVIDTWLMSCRVLKRGVEQETMNEILRLARLRGCKRVVGLYVPTKKNGMVSGLYPGLGFSAATGEAGRFTLELTDDTHFSSHIKISRSDA
jgi:FkbH-like protein